MERINNRIDCHFGFEQHFICGIVRLTIRVGLAILVMVARCRWPGIRNGARPYPTGLTRADALAGATDRTPVRSAPS
ncbi:MAG TPA: hypothetical protein DDY14_14080 [Chromatiaceae bacterium]|nr:hypothetical protein [Chromatiaceae bacterium]